MAAIKKQSLVDQVYAKLREGIITMRMPLGSKVNVNELQNDLGVSCTPIREAVNRLQQEGLVVYRNNVGAHVLTLDEHDVEEIQELAATLHCAAIRLAMEKGDRKVVTAELEKFLEDYQKAKTPQSEVTAVNHFMGAFYLNCGNLRLEKSMISIQGQQLLLRYIYANALAMRGGDYGYFLRMLEGVRAGDTGLVCATLQSYVDHMTEVVLTCVQTGGADAGKN